MPPVSKISPTVIPTVDPTKNWLSYIDDKNRFIFKYPSTWLTEKFSEGDGVTISYPEFAPKSSVTIIQSTVENEVQKVKQDIDKVNSAKLISENVIWIGGIKGAQLIVHFPDAGAEQTFYSFVSNNYQVFIIKWGTDINDEYRNIYNQILSTFTFLDQKSNSGWQTVTIDLYNLSLQIPSDWELQEINRRPEPSSPEAPTKGHDCADYTIKSDNNYAILSLKPTCGFADGGASLWPNDAVIVKQYQSGYPKFIIRFFDQNNNSYKYSGAGEATISNLEGTRTEKTYADPPIISFGSQSDLTLVGVEFSYIGPETSKNQYLETADKIVASLEKF